MMEDPQLEKALVRAYRLLSHRDRSIQELRGRLLEKGFEKRTVDAVVDRLVDARYLDDERFAYEWARSCAVNRIWGDRKILFSLKEKGIGEELADEVIRAVRGEMSEKEAITLLIGKRLRKIREGRGIDDKISGKDIRRMISTLAGRGFSPANIFDVIGNVKEEGFNDG